MYESPKNWARKVENKAKQDPWDSSAHNLEARTGLNGIAGHYHLPEGMKREDLEVLLDRQVPYWIAERETENQDISQHPKLGDFLHEGRQHLPLLVNMIHQISSINPELKRITFNQFSSEEVKNVLSGILYDFGPNEIQYFVNGIANRDPNYRNEEWERLQEVVQAVTDPTYILSPPTMMDIIDRHPMAHEKAMALGLDLDAIKARLQDDSGVIPPGRGQLEHRESPSIPVMKFSPAIEPVEDEHASKAEGELPLNVRFLLATEQHPSVRTANARHKGRMIEKTLGDEVNADNKSQAPQR